MVCFGTCNKLSCAGMLRELLSTVGANMIAIPFALILLSDSCWATLKDGRQGLGMFCRK